MATDTPTPFRDIMVTYEKTISSGPYGDTKTKAVVTKRGFYTDLFDYVAVPPDWQMFGGALLPHGFGGDKVPLDKVISWKYAE